MLKLLGLPAQALHAQQQQRQRLKALDRFKANGDGVLVATDVAARGEAPPRPAPPCRAARPPRRRAIARCRPRSCSAAGAETGAAALVTARSRTRLLLTVPPAFSPHIPSLSQTPTTPQVWTSGTSRPWCTTRCPPARTPTSTAAAAPRAAPAATASRSRWWAGARGRARGAPGLTGCLSQLGWGLGAAVWRPCEAVNPAPLSRARQVSPGEAARWAALLRAMGREEDPPPAFPVDRSLLKQAGKRVSLAEKVRRPPRVWRGASDAARARPPLRLVHERCFGRDT